MAAIAFLLAVRTKNDRPKARKDPCQMHLDNSFKCFALFLFIFGIFLPLVVLILLLVTRNRNTI